MKVIVRNDLVFEDGTMVAVGDIIEVDEGETDTWLRFNGVSILWDEVVTVEDLVYSPQDRYKYIAELMATRAMAAMDVDNLAAREKFFVAAAELEIERDIALGDFFPAGKTIDERKASKEAELLLRLGSDHTEVSLLHEKAKALLRITDTELEIQLFLLKHENIERDYIERIQRNNIKAVEVGAIEFIMKEGVE